MRDNADPSDGVVSPLETNRKTRRRFLACAGVAGGLAACGSRLAGGAEDSPKCELKPPPATGSETQATAYPFPRFAKTRYRRSLREVVADPKALAKLTDAYGKLKKLPKDDPRSWCEQANLHYKHCSFPAGGNGQTPYYLQVHFGWFFLPWHRAYLYFFESLLGSLIADESFALPYWDWSNDLTVPDVFFDPASPLYHSLRDVKKGQSILDDLAVRDRTKPDTIEAIKSIPYFYPLLQNLTGSFGGPPDSLESDTLLQGALEANPHNAIHNWVGGDMGAFETAARDFLFFCHHANVDRLWAEWMQRPGHTNPSSQTWLTQWFNFVDPKGQSVSITAADTVDFTRVNVLYQPPQTQTERLAMLRAKKENPTVLEGRQVEVTARLRIVGEGRKRLAPAARRRTIRLTVDGFEAPDDAALRIHAFLNKEGADAKTPLTDEHYVGTFFIVPMQSPNAARAGHPEKKHPHPPRTLNLDISERAAGLLGGAAPKVTLVPVDRQGKPSQAKVQFRSVSVLIED